MSSDRDAFLAAIDAAPWDDELPRLVYADWLDERGEHEEANRQRKWVESSRWLREFAEELGSNYSDYDDPGEPITYEQVVEAGRNYAATGQYFIQYGSQEAQRAMGEEKVRRDFWRHWSVVTGLPVPPDEYGEPPGVFSCSC